MLYKLIFIIMGLSTLLLFGRKTFILNDDLNASNF